jgi:hypothetical protein
MSRHCIFMVVISFPAILWGQSSGEPTPPPYQPAVPLPSNVNAYGGYYSSPGTAAGSAMNGMANVISAQGNYNLATSAAAINMTQARRNEIQNAQLYTDAYFQMRATNRAARKAEAGPPATMEQLARIAHSGAPRPITEKELNPESGQINWPTALQQKTFDKQRAELEEVVLKQVRYGGLSFADQMQARNAIETMFAGLKENIETLPPQQYADSRSFLNSMIYATCRSQL